LQPLSLRVRPAARLLNDGLIPLLLEPPTKDEIHRTIFHATRIKRQRGPTEPLNVTVDVGQVRMGFGPRRLPVLGQRAFLFAGLQLVRCVSSTACISNVRTFYISAHVTRWNISGDSFQLNSRLTLPSFRRCHACGPFSFLHSSLNDLKSFSKLYTLYGPRLSSKPSSYEHGFPKSLSFIHAPCRIDLGSFSSSI